MVTPMYTISPECLSPCRVSCVDAQSAQSIISGSYDGNVRIWNGKQTLASRRFIITCSGDRRLNKYQYPERWPGFELYFCYILGEMQCQTTFHAHADGVNAVACLPAGQGEGLILTAGKDHLVKLWQSSSGPKDSWSCRLVAQYAAHADAVESIALSPSGDRMASCGWDGALLLWRAGAAVLDAATEAAAGSAPASTLKKRKLGGGKGASAEAEAPVSIASVDESPLSRLEGHLHCVSSAAWPVETSLYSGGWDHSVGLGVGAGIIQWVCAGGVC